MKYPLRSRMGSITQVTLLLLSAVTICNGYPTLRSLPTPTSSTNFSITASGTSSWERGTQSLAFLESDIPDADVTASPTINKRTLTCTNVDATWLDSTCYIDGHTVPGASIPPTTTTLHLTSSLMQSSLPKGTTPRPSTSSSYFNHCPIPKANGDCGPLNNGQCPSTRFNDTCCLLFPKSMSQYNTCTTLPQGAYISNTTGQIIGSGDSGSGSDGSGTPGTPPSKGGSNMTLIYATAGGGGGALLLAILIFFCWRSGKKESVAAASENREAAREKAAAEEAKKDAEANAIPEGYELQELPDGRVRTMEYVEQSDGTMKTIYSYTRPTRSPSPPTPEPSPPPQPYMPPYGSPYAAPYTGVSVGVAGPYGYAPVPQAYPPPAPYGYPVPYAPQPQPTPPSRSKSRNKNVIRM